MRQGAPADDHSRQLLENGGKSGGFFASLRRLAFAHNRHRPRNLTLTVEAGVSMRELSLELSRQGLYLRLPDLAGTLGGLLAAKAARTYAMKFLESGCCWPTDRPSHSAGKSSKTWPATTSPSSCSAPGKLRRDFRGDPKALRPAPESPNPWRSDFV